MENTDFTSQSELGRIFSFEFVLRDTGKIGVFRLVG